MLFLTKKSFLKKKNRPMDDDDIKTKTKLGRDANFLVCTPPDVCGTAQLLPMTLILLYPSFDNNTNKKKTIMNVLILCPACDVIIFSPRISSL